MVLVRGNDAYVGIEIAGETIYGTDPMGGYARVHPLLEESLTVERQPFPRSKELGAGLGALSSYDAGRAIVRGSFTVYPVYNSAWWAKLMGHAHGGVEQVRTGISVSGGSLPGGFAAGVSHAWAPQSFKSGAMTSTPNLPLYGSTSGVAPGLSIRVWKAGPSLGSTPNEMDDRTVEVYTGCLIESWRWEQPEDDRPRCTFNFIGRSLTPTGLGTNSGMLRLKHLPVPAGSVVNGSPGWTNSANVTGLPDSTYATASAANQTMVLGNFGLTAFPSTSGTIMGIQAIVEAYAAGAGTPTLTLELSADGGSTYPYSLATSTLTGSRATYYLGGSTSLWGKGSWSTTELNDTNFKVRAKATGTATTWYLDSVRFQVFTSVTGLLPVDPNQVEVSMRDFYHKTGNAYAPGLSYFSAVLGTGASTSRVPKVQNLRSFTVTFNNHIEAPPSFLTAIDTIEKAGHTAPWECQFELGTLVETNFYDSYSPQWIFNPSTNAAGLSAYIRFRYVSQGWAYQTDVPYALDIFIPRMMLTACEAGASTDNVLPMRITGEAQLGEILTSETSLNITAGQYLPVPWLIQTLDGNISVGNPTGQYGL